MGLCVFARADYADWGDSGTKGPSYETILKWTDRLAIEYPTKLMLEDYGMSVKGRPLRLMLVMDSRPFTAKRPAMVMTGSTHGNEYLNIEDRLPEELLKKSTQPGPVQDYINGGGVFIFVPILNPDGYSARKRANANGVDLNRDWDLPTAGHSGFKEVETVALANTLERYRTRYNLNFEITVDYHCCAGALLTPWGYTGENLPEPSLQAHRQIGDLANRQLNVVVGATGQVLGYFPMGTTKDYYFARYGALAFTYEGRFGSEKSKLPEHVAWWEDMVAFLNKRRNTPPPVALFDRLLSSINL